jgi:hypothetical protein
VPGLEGHEQHISLCIAQICGYTVEHRLVNERCCGCEIDCCVHSVGKDPTPWT